MSKFTKTTFKFIFLCILGLSTAMASAQDDALSADGYLDLLSEIMEVPLNEELKAEKLINQLVSNIAENPESAQGISVHLAKNLPSRDELTALQRLRIEQTYSSAQIKILELLKEKDNREKWVSMGSGAALGGAAYLLMRRSNKSTATNSPIGEAIGMLLVVAATGGGYIVGEAVINPALNAFDGISDVDLLAIQEGIDAERATINAN